MLEHHHLFRQPLGARGAHIVFTQHIEHGGAREADDQRGVEHAQHHRRQHEVVKAFGQRGAWVAVARHRKPAHGHGKNLHQHQPEPETGNAGAQHGKAGQELVNELAAKHRRNNAAGHANRRCNEDGHQCQQGGGLGPLPQRLGDRALQEDGLAQVALRQLLEPVAKLHRQRLVQAILFLHADNVFRRCLVAQQHRDGVARCGACEHKHDDRHERHDHQHAHDA